MPQYQVMIKVMPRPGLLDPEGLAVKNALGQLGYPEISEVSVGKAVHLTLDRANGTDVRKEVEAMCEKLLANPVTQDYTIEVRSEE